MMYRWWKSRRSSQEILILIVRYKGPPAPQMTLKLTAPTYLYGVKMLPHGVRLLDGTHQNNVNQSFDVFVTEQPFVNQSKMQVLV